MLPSLTPLDHNAQKLTRHVGRRWLGISVRLASEQDIVHYPDNADIKIPLYAAASDETIEKQRSRLVYQSRKRGILENDLILSTFAAAQLNKMTKQQLDAYDKLINTARNDWDIYYWMTGKESTPKEFDSDVMDMLKEHVLKNKGMRIKQPDLPS
ncbi:protein emi5 mitochondrial [Holotrichia oblita]|uniref:Protein emi5 mitochondrial n=1 Tax=Holotrichia oblita TaxID=644536 RepID=A0ACB9SYF9_HOLOL|nr:protein emi5 mitochondrial [Holotrichia oblita]